MWKLYILLYGRNQFIKSRDTLLQEKVKTLEEKLYQQNEEVRNRHTKRLDELMEEGKKARQCTNDATKAFLSRF